MNNLFKKGLILGLFSLVVVQYSYATNRVHIFVMKQNAIIRSLKALDTNTLRLTSRPSEVIDDDVSVFQTNAQAKTHLDKRLKEKFNLNESEFFLFAITENSTATDEYGTVNLMTVLSTPQSIEQIDLSKIHAILVVPKLQLPAQYHHSNNNYEHNKSVFVLCSPLHTIGYVYAEASQFLKSHSEYSSAEIEARLGKSGIVKDSTKFVYEYVKEAGDKPSDKKAEESKEKSEESNKDSSEEYKDESKSNDDNDGKK